MEGEIINKDAIGGCATIQSHFELDRVSAFLQPGYGYKGIQIVDFYSRPGSVCRGMTVEQNLDVVNRISAPF